MLLLEVTDANVCPQVHVPPLIIHSSQVNISNFTLGGRNWGLEKFWKLFDIT